MTPKTPPPPTFWELYKNRIRLPSACILGDGTLLIEILAVNLIVFLGGKVYEAWGSSPFFVKKLEDMDQLASLIIILIFVLDSIATIGLAAIKRGPE